MKLQKIILPLIFVAGCDKDFEFSPKDSSPNESNQLKALYQEDVTLSVVSDAEPNKYWLKISWPKASGSVVILENGKRLTRSTPTKSNYEKLYNGGDKLEIGLTQDGAEEVFYSKQIEIPEDLIISSSKILTSDLVFKGGRFYLTGSAKIQALDFNVKIEVDEFYSENGLIETFPLGQKANWEVDGRSAGNIIIQAKKSYGSLIVNLRGEDGGDGKSSVCHRAFTMLCNASSAGNGGSFGQFRFESQNSKDFNITLNKHSGVGGMGGTACLYTLAPDVINSMPRSKYIAFENNCEGHGAGINNGLNGFSGAGEVCLKLNEVDKNVCE